MIGHRENTMYIYISLCGDKCGEKKEIWPNERENILNLVGRGEKNRTRKQQISVYFQ